MGRDLAGRDLRAALSLIERVSGAPTVAEFYARALPALHELVPADIVALSDMDPVRHTAVVVDHPTGSMFAGVDEALARHLAEHPIVRYYERTGDSCVTRLSDFISLREFRQTGLFHEAFRPLGMERLLVAGRLPVRKPRIAGIAHFRGSGDFSESDRARLELVRRPLAAAYEQAEQTEMVAVLERASGSAGVGVVLLSPTWTVLRQTPSALGLLVEAFGEPVDEDSLPDAVQRWLEDGCRTHLGAVVSGRRIVIECQRNGLACPALVVHDRSHPQAIGPGPVRLGRRETEVLGHVAAGRTNRQIAAQLGIRPLTVKKHLERIYGKLGVANRAQAVAATLGSPDV